MKLNLAYAGSLDPQNIAVGEQIVQFNEIGLSCHLTHCCVDPCFCLRQVWLSVRLKLQRICKGSLDNDGFLMAFAPRKSGAILFVQFFWITCKVYWPYQFRFHFSPSETCNFMKCRMVFVSLPSIYGKIYVIFDNEQTQFCKISCPGNFLSVLL